ncbi:TnsD family Tn7-like transposition protein [Geomonas ferrireducens]|uniref:TnsD family Tn7-like transposition protein n=1 Tax=Geomonas ferrireducens TaxID=2570227 RepID=UPI0010A77571|nr:TnsD family Tn7-like transposition protein [Geomonas ferrireducens]
MIRPRFIYLPFPYQDELLYSVLARYCSRSNQRPHKLACLIFDKCFVILRADLPCALSAVARKTKPTWGMTAETILKELTLFPFYEPFLPKPVRDNRMHALLLGPCRCNIGTKAYRVKSPIFLRLCVKCAESDREELAETYWRRVHQLPGVIVCPQHGTPLVSTLARIQPGRTECVDASSATFGNTEPLDNLDIEIIQMIAMRCKDVLFGKKNEWDGKTSATDYRDAALKRGIQRLPGICSPNLFVEKFLAHYGAPLLTKLGMLGAEGKAPWLRNMFQNNSKQIFHPIEHILVQLYLESLPEVASAYPFGLGPWMCPNPYATHTEKYPIQKLSIRSRQDKTYYGRAKCSCGFTFTTHGTERDNPRMPVVEQISSYGCTRYLYAQKLLRGGSSTDQIAKILKVNPWYLQCILRAGSRKCEDPRGKILKAREEWLDLLKQDPECRVTVARKKHCGLYQFLRKYDRDWLLCQKVPHNAHIDWQKRDVEWSNLIATTMKTLGQGVAKTTIARVAGLNLRIFNQFGKLPLCEQAFNKAKHCGKRRQNDEK